MAGAVSVSASWWGVKAVGGRNWRKIDMVDLLQCIKPLIVRALQD
jgi:hypothetical protein